jgi:hypothetical protein
MFIIKFTNASHYTQSSAGSYFHSSLLLACIYPLIHSLQLCLTTRNCILTHQRYNSSSNSVTLNIIWPGCGTGTLLFTSVLRRVWDPPNPFTNVCSCPIRREGSLPLCPTGICTVAAGHWKLHSLSCSVKKRHVTLSWTYCTFYDSVLSCEYILATWPVWIEKVHNILCDKKQLSHSTGTLSLKTEQSHSP